MDAEFDVGIFCDGPFSRELTDAINIFVERFTSKVYLLKSSQSKGLAYALNHLIILGIRHDYKYFVRADTDDRMRQDRLKILISEADKRLNVDAVGSNYSYFGAKNKKVTLPECNSEIKRRFAYSTSIAHATLLIKRSFFEKAGLYTSGFYSLIEDQRLWASAFRNDCSFYNVQQNLYYVRTSRSLFLRRLQFRTRFHLLCLKASFCFSQLALSQKYLIVFLSRDCALLLVSVLVFPFLLTKSLINKIS